MPKDLSIYKFLKGHRYELSVFSTYSVTFPFYEEVVLPHLLANGCHRNIVVADMGQCSASFAEPTTRPRRAGVDYYLLPVRQSSAFHPKICLLLGNGAGAAFVGSHNLTIQGFGLNAELTNVFEYRRQKDAPFIFRNILEFLSDWTRNVSEILPAPISTMGLRLLQSLPEEPDAEQDTLFVGTSSRGPSLWTKIRELVPANVEKVTVVGPFFDDQLAFLKGLQSTFQPKKIQIGIEPDTVQISPKARTILPNVQFRNCSGLLGAGGYLHAKVVLLETKHQEILITGSANPSRPAWIATGSEANAEAVIVRVLTRNSSVVTDLGLRRIDDAPEITPAHWDKIADRKSKLNATAEHHSAGVFSAVETKGGFQLIGSIDKMPAEIAILDSTGNLLVVLPVIKADWPQLRVESGGLRGAAAMLELRLNARVLGYACVHHLRRLQGFGSSVQKDLHRHLANLQGNDADVAGLIELVQKVIFDRPVELTEKTRKQGKSLQKNRPTAVTEFAQFSVNLDELEKHDFQKELVSAGNLGEILDLLIRVLGRDLTVQPTSDVEPTKNEEELIDSEDEALVKQSSVDGIALVEACQRKVGTLYSRMRKRLEASQGDASEAVRTICQLAAVLATVCVLRNSAEKAPWIPKGYSLVPEEKSREFLHAASLMLYGSDGLIAAVDSTFGADSCAELAQVRGLMLWLAWDCGIDIRTIRPMDGMDVNTEEIYDLNSLLCIGREIVPDDDARKYARDAVCDSDPANGRDWLQYQLRWAYQVYHIGLNPKKAKTLDRIPLPGDVVFRNLTVDFPLTVVLESYQDKVALADSEGKKYKASYVSVLDIPLQTSKADHRARGIGSGSSR